MFFPNFYLFIVVVVGASVVVVDGAVVVEGTENEQISYKIL